MSKKELSKIKDAVLKLGQSDLEDCANTVEDILGFIHNVFQRKEYHKKRKEYHKERKEKYKKEVAVLEDELEELQDEKEDLEIQLEDFLTQ